MLAMLERCPADRHVPVIRGGDDHAIDPRLCREQFPVVGVDPCLGQPLDLAGGLQLLPVDVAERNDPLIELGELLKEVAAHLPPHADAGEGERLVVSRLRPHLPRQADPRSTPGRDGRRSDRRGSGETAPEERAAGERMVGYREGGHVLTPGARHVLGQGSADHPAAGHDRRGQADRPSEQRPSGVSLRQIRQRG